MNGLGRFVNAGLGEADQRIGRRLPPAVTDHPWVLDAIDSGVTARWVGRVITMGRAASESSVALHALRTMRSTWQSAHWSSRRRTVGLMFLTAVAVHGALVIWDERPVGWIWMIVPGLSAASGVLLMLASTASPNGDRK